MRWWFKAFALFFLLFGGCLLFSIGLDLFDGGKAHGTWEIIVSVVFPIVGLGLTAHAFASRVEFSGTSLQRVTLLSHLSIPLSSIRGRREYVLRGGEEGGDTRYLRLERNDGAPPVEFGKYLYRFDDDFWDWFNALPDLDEIDRVKHKDSNFGLI